MLGRGVATSAGPLSLTAKSAAVRPGCVLELAATGRPVSWSGRQAPATQRIFQAALAHDEQGPVTWGDDRLRPWPFAGYRAQPMFATAWSSPWKLSRIMTICKSAAGSPPHGRLRPAFFGRKARLRRFVNNSGDLGQNRAGEALRNTCGGCVGVFRPDMGQASKFYRAVVQSTIIALKMLLHAAQEHIYQNTLASVMKSMLCNTLIYRSLACKTIT